MHHPSTRAQAAVLDEVVASGQASEVVESIKLYRTLRKIKEQLHDVLMHKVQSRCVGNVPQLGAHTCTNGTRRATQSPGVQQPFRLHTNLMQTTTGTGRHIIVHALPARL